ncbi:hypothetical protein Bbelb_311340 [Branchiostoma belcheri]|nr:hypothetical protein Bbelb_311340 [Branchiostoma belcheri]
MFTSRGSFVRTVARIRKPDGIALGPDGRLVVSSIIKHRVTIFPRRTVGVEPDGSWLALECPASQTPPGLDSPVAVIYTSGRRAFAARTASLDSRVCLGQKADED